jgi:Protein of unknown function (DUF4058)
MPLRDHFRPPVSSHHSWEGFHATWPVMAVQRLFPALPEGYTAEPRVHLGQYYELDIGGFESENGARPGNGAGGAGGIATVPRPAPPPTSTIEADLGEQYEYEVKVFDDDRGRTLVAAVEFVSPANKDRPEHRRAFLAKCVALLQKGVCVTIVDVVTVRQFNLYADLRELIGQADAALEPEPPYLYGVTIRGRKRARQGPLLDTWFYPLTLGQPMPSLPIWLDVDLHVLLDLEGSYEDTCRVLRIT